MKKWSLQRDRFSHIKLLEELRLEPDDYRNYLRMDEDSYVLLLKLVTPLIQKQDTCMRSAIPPHERLSVTLRYLATGRNYEDLKFSSIISPQSLSKIIPEICSAIYQVLKDEYIKFPTTENEWNIIANDYETKCNFPNCVGVVDGKHVNILPPAGSGSYFYNYKGGHSLVLMAIVNANYEFIMVDFGVNGRISDGGVIDHTIFYQKLKNGKLSLPPKTKPKGSKNTMTFVFIGDESLSLRCDFLKSFGQNELNHDRKIFNYRLSRARCRVENTFGILSARFRIFQGAISISLESIEKEVMAACVLHNLRRRYGNAYVPEDNVYRENVQDGKIDIRLQTTGMTKLQCGYNRKSALRLVLVLVVSNVNRNRLCIDIYPLSTNNMESKPEFSDLKLKKWIIKQCDSIGVKHPTPIQAGCIPKILEGQSCVGAAKTGSGKTLAFALPIVQTLCEDPYGIYALVLTPTRELAYQIAEQFSVIGKPMNLKTCVVVGGMDMVEQGIQLSKNPHIVVATPGRLADHLQSCKTFTLSRIKFLVLDEADRLLGGHFDDQIKTIFGALPKNRQNLFFSATITDTLNILKSTIGDNVFLFEDKTKEEAATVTELEQQYLLCPKDVKDAYMVELLRVYRDNNEDGNVMIFTDTCKNCQVLSITLNEVGIENVALHAMIPQAQRLAALNRFKSNRVKILIATDVASRGLDIPTVQLVINHNVPRVPKEYIHRVGRTARAGRGGKAVTLVTPYDIKLLKAIEELIKVKLSEYKLDDKEVGKIFTQVSVTKSEAYIKLDETDFYEKKMINLKKKWILEGLDPDEEEQKFLEKTKKAQIKHKNKAVKRLKTKKKAVNSELG
ncbi:probable ATP-dependent RNA helicase DDX49 [Anthonomus grandis grandis]|uniref:probable ATP-dependent RNA helicase DDX49 n=1 Tax=Anthonomus grandis grandis TaxID=2921223 RepID=UPI00216609B4|nr:probable ATP-dependent RNA helicase DDX49 [Anthonomus grandis grandis]